MIPAPTLVQLCMGVPWGAPDDLNTFLAMVNNVPADWFWSAFSIGRNQMAYVAASVQMCIRDSQSLSLPNMFSILCRFR